VLPSTATLSHRKHASTSISCDICYAQEQDQIKTCDMEGTCMVHGISHKFVNERVLGRTRIGIRLCLTEMKSKMWFGISGLRIG
jgi:hypothetical protein